MDRQHAMELEADGTRLDVAHPGQEHRAQKALIADALVDLRGGDIEQFFTRRFLNESDERLDFGAELYCRGRDVAVGRMDPRQATEEGEVAQAGQRAGRERALDESAAIVRR